MNLTQAAAARLRAIATRRPDRTDLVAVADHATSMADARTALCIAQGAPLDDIELRAGYSLTRDAYEASRKSWRTAVTDDGGLTDYTRPWYEDAVAWWTAQRPQFIDGDDWLAGICTDPRPIGA